MWCSKGRILLVIAVQLLLVYSKDASAGIKLLSLKEKIPIPVKTVEGLSSKLANPTHVVDEISDAVLHSKDTVQNLTELVATTAIYVRNNVTLNCLGLPLDAFAKALELILTQETKAKDVRFYFSTRNLSDQVTIGADQPLTLQDVDFDIKRPTVLMTHGFMSSGKESWLKNMKDHILLLEDVNAIIVDWQRGSNTWNYYSAALSTRIVGVQIAKLFAQIRELAKNLDNVPDIDEWGSLYFIGHSLGAHIIAHAAHLIKESQKDIPKKWIVSRITGLDPAQPCFKTTDLTLKLDKNDATFVDVIHTNARNIFLLGLGLPDQLGFVDFYPNGGELQPGCDIDTSIWNFILIPQHILKETICSHGRSHAFLTESIIDTAAGNCTFIGHKWDRSRKSIEKVLTENCEEGNCSEMGITSVIYYPKATGIYFVPTRNSPPYCGNNESELRNTAKNYNYKKNIFTRIAKAVKISH